MTPDDLRLLRHVARHRMLRSSHLTAILPHRPPKKLIERIGMLYHAGYLDRPKAQLDYYDRTGSAPLVYELGHRASQALPELPRGWRPKRGVRRQYIEHTLMVAEIALAFEKSVAKRKDVALLDQHALALELRAAGGAGSFSLSVEIPHKGKRVRVPVSADAVLALRYSSGHTDFFFVEADRGTMTLESSDMTQSSFRRKLVGYEAALRGQQHLDRFGFKNARVLTVTNSKTRLAAMLRLLRNVTSRRPTGRFLFIDHPTLLGGDVMTLPWSSLAGEIKLLRSR